MKGVELFDIYEMIERQLFSSLSHHFKELNLELLQAILRLKQPSTQDRIQIWLVLLKTSPFCEKYVNLFFFAPRFSSISLLSSSNYSRIRHYYYLMLHCFKELIIIETDIEILDLSGIFTWLIPPFFCSEFGSKLSFFVFLTPSQVLILFPLLWRFYEH